MSTVASLSPRALRRQLAGPGIGLQTGAFVTRLRSPIRHMADAIGLLYADYPLVPDPAFADFYVEMARVGGLRRFIGRQVLFLHDGQPPFRPLPLDHAVPMFEWSLNWCVSSRAHDYLILHAAVIERGGRAAILPAPPGSGKSTLCAALVASGWRLLSDELTMVRLADGLVEPLPRPISLKNRSIEVIRAFAPQAVISRSVHDTTKGTVAHMKPPADSVARAHEAVRAAWIVFPQYAADAPATLAPMVPMAPARAFMQVADNGFNYGLLGRAGFDALGRLMAGAASYQFRYSALDGAIAAFERLAVASAP